MNAVPRFRLVGAGIYETDDGRFELRQLDGGRTRAWNVELTNDAIEEWVAEDPERRSPYSPELDTMPVDGARTKRDALLLFADWWNQQQQAGSPS